MFKEEREVPMFEWGMIGDIKEGRANLGADMDVTIYRMMQFTLRDVLIQRMGVDLADEVFYAAGREAGRHFYKNVITKKDDFNEMVADLQRALREYKIGIMRMEKADLENLKFTIAVAEDLDCSGLPVSNEVVCKYDEGFISGILNEHTGLSFNVKEVDCWCSGDRVCRFEAVLETE
ncbi:MAG: 4-vinyl reductase [Nitrospinota bacterium]|nr:4-vinyl reductase [Nitrospinota bacterium]MDH5677101.1 4-vinyl reductase [Nitrospinota bacterium]